MTFLAAGVQPVCPPIVATHLVKLACELPDTAGIAIVKRESVNIARGVDPRAGV